MGPDHPSSVALATEGEHEAPTREKFAWCMFDFANSAFPTVALTAFGGPYFQSVLCHGGVDLLGWNLTGTAAWGLCIAISMFLVTVTAPITGLIADRGGGRKKFLFAYVALCLVALVGLSTLGPGSGGWAMLFYIVANFAFEGAYVFYNAYLPDLTATHRLGRLSGYGWALGYGGGLLVLVACFPLLPEAYTPETAGQARWVYLVVALWYAVFSLPAWLWLHDRAPSRGARERIKLSDAFREVAKTFRTARAHRVVFLFLLAYFLYNDGITTVIEFVGIFTQEVLAFTPKDQIILFLVLNVIAAPGAIFFGRLLDRIGGRRAISYSLLVWVMVVVGASLVQTKVGFWPVAVLAAIVIGATQASSRAYMAKIAPAGRTGEFMGFLALSGKASAIFGPLLYGGVVQVAHNPASPGDSHRIAIVAIGGLFVVSWFVMRRLPKDERAPTA